MGRNWITSRWKIKVHRITKPFNSRSHVMKTRHIITLSLIGFIWYTFLLRWIPNDGRQQSKPSSVIHSLRSLLERKYREEPTFPIQARVPEKTDFNYIQTNHAKLTEVKQKHGQGMALMKNDQSPPIILVWKAMEYQMRLYKIHLEYTMTPECGGCRVTTNRSVVSECAALVHFNAPDLQRHMDVPDPKTRNPNQIYAFWSRETPSKTYSFHKVLQDPRFDPIFNLTMNFRFDADIIDYFGNFEYELRFFKGKNKNNQLYKRIMGRKTGLAMWAVSNCNNTYGARERMKYAKRLIDAGLKLTAYGTCFDVRYEGSDIVAEFMRHKFYLSFENSVHCPDYISEKFWRNGLRAGSVPVVWGPTKSDVAAIAPPHSYIHVEDYKSPKKLVEYLNYLDKNDTAYREYHAWRFAEPNENMHDEDIIPNHRSTLCRLCKKVLEKPLVHKTIPSVHDWLYNTRYADNLCFKNT